jgi:hypothetical protein
LGGPHKFGDFTWDRCPKRAVLDNPWIGAVWAATDLVTLEHSNRAHDAVSTAKAAEAWRQRQEFEQSERERAAKNAATKAQRAR